jgi:predicted RNase H-like nuclease (RuvC/YqgF family)
VEFDELEHFQEQLKRRVKWLVGPAVVALVIGMPVLALWGISESEDLRSKIKEAKDDIDKTRNEAKNAITDLAAKARKETNSSMEEIKRQISALNKLSKELQAETEESRRKWQDLEEKRQYIEEIATTINESKIRAEKLREQVQKDSEEVRNIRNSYFEVFIHVRRTTENDQQTRLLTNLIKELGQKGYQVSTENITDVTVDKSEVIYYHTTAQNQAVDVADILTVRLGIRVQTREIKEDQDTRHIILVKINIL